MGMRPRGWLAAPLISVAAVVVAGLAPAPAAATIGVWSTTTSTVTQAAQLPSVSAGVTHISGGSWLDSARATSPSRPQGFGRAPSGLLTPISDVLCAVTGVVSALPLLGGLFKPVDTVACALDVLEYEFHTTGVGPDGEEIVRTTPALVGLPTQIDVDGQPGADLTGTIKPEGGLDRLVLTINRTATGSDPLPAAVEILVKDPTGSVGATHVAFGYDQLDSTVPGTFEAELTLEALLDEEAPTLDLEVTQDGGNGELGDSTELIAETFDGSALDREHVVKARLGYEESPSVAGLKYVMTEPAIIQLETDRPGPVSGEMSLRGEQDMDIAVAAADMGNVFRVDLAFETPRILYTGSDAAGEPHTIDDLEVRVESGEALMGRATRMRAGINGLPSGTELIADSVNGEFSLVATQAIDEVEVFAGSDAEQPGDLPPAGTQGARFVDRAGAPYVIGARVQGLRALRAHLGDTMDLDVESAGGDFDAEFALDDIRATAGIDGLPRTASVTVDTQNATFRYDGSSVMDRIEAEVVSASPLVAGVNEFGLLLEGIPTEVTVEADLDTTAASLTASAPIDLVELSAKSAGATPPSGPLDGGESGIVLRDRADGLAVLARVRGLRNLRLSMAPMILEASVREGQVFVGDVTTESAGPAELNAKLRVDGLPSQLWITMDEGGPDDATELQYRSSDTIDRVSVDVGGVELLEGADTAKVVVHDLPTALDLSMPAEGPTVAIEADRPVGQVRVAAGAADVALPERSIAGGPVGDDLVDVTFLPGQSSARIRLTAVRSLALSFDPMSVTMRQDAAKARPIDATAVIESGSEAGEAHIEARFDKPTALTSLSAVFEEGQPVRLEFDNAGPMDSFTLVGEGMEGVSEFDVRFDDIPSRLSICLDPGPLCRRHNPNPIYERLGDIDGGRPYPAEVSADFDDHGTHGGQSMTTLNAKIALPGSPEPVEITDLRFENLGFDLGSAASFSGPCSFGDSNSRVYMFFDSRGKRFVLGDAKLPPRINSFQIGTLANMAAAHSRIAWLRGCSKDGLRFKLDRRSRGSMTCGGRRVFKPGDTNVLDIPIVGQAVPLCGGW